MPNSPSAPTVQIPRECEDLAQEVPYPPVYLKQSAKASEARHRAALKQANENLSATRQCQEQQRLRYAGE
ncbi:MAG: hypothetical protein WBB98_10810 [Xanthobacteraceae bacterium]